MQSNHAPIIEDSVIEAASYTTIKTARKAMREMMKKFNLIRHAGHIVNYSKQIELHTNF